MVNGADVQGGILSRAVGGNAYRLGTQELSARFDNIDVYRTMHENLFGVFPEYPEGQRAPERSTEASVTMPETGGVSLGGLPAWALAGGAVLLLGLGGLFVFAGSRIRYH